MSNKKISCYSSYLIHRDAVSRGLDKNLFSGIETHREALLNPNAWTTDGIWTRMARNFETALGGGPGVLEKAAESIMSREIRNFQILFVKISPLTFLASNLSKHMSTSVNRNLTASIELPGPGEMLLTLKPVQPAEFSRQICEFNKGSTLALIKAKGYTHVRIEETVCAARGHEACQYRITWTPRPNLFHRIKETFLFRFRDHASIIRHMEESHRSLQDQYREILTLKNKLQASRDFLNHIMQNINEGICWLDPAGKIVFTNTAFRKLTGLPEQALEGRFLWSLLSSEHTEMDYRLFFIQGQEKKAVPQTREFTFVRENGDARVGETAFTWITDGPELPGFLVTVRDITEKKRLAEEFFALESRYRDLYENSPALIVGIDPKGRFLYANPAMEKQCGYSEAELKNMHFGALVAPDADFDVARLVKDRLDKEPKLQEVRFKTKAGDWIAVALNTFPVRDPNGRLAAVAGIGVDITETKRLNEQLVHTQRMDLLGKLAGGLAHDFNNILLAISGYSRLLNKKDKSAETQEYASIISQAADRAGELTKQLLTFSRGEIDKRERFPLNPLASEVRALLLPLVPKHIGVAVEVPEREIFVQGDSGKIHQCVLNLCINARDAMENKGQSIHIRVKEPDESGCAVVEVEDDGPGIPPDIIDKIFDPFFSTKKRGKGTGLGLSVVYGIVRSHNGRISVDSRPGEGACFRIELPVLEPAPAAPANAGPAGADKSGLVMIVDDEALVRGFCEDIIRGAGFQTIQFGSGEEAVEWFKGNASAVGFTVADIILPEMDGVEMGGRLREIRPDLAILWMTGFVSPNMNKPPATDTVLIKPFTPAELLEALNKLFRRETVS